jgi:hypothetical protein
MTTEEQFALLEKYAPGTEVVFLDNDGATREGVVIAPIMFADDIEWQELFPQFSDPPPEGTNEPYLLMVEAPRDGDGKVVPGAIRWRNVVGVKE